MTASLLSLPWLPRAPLDFNGRCNAIDFNSPGVGSALQSLSTHALSPSQATRLSRRLAQIRAGGGDIAPLSGFRLALLANATCDLLTDAYIAAALRHGVTLEIGLPPFDQVMQQTLDEGSEFYQAAPDAVLLALDHRWLGLSAPALDNAARAVEAAIGRLRTVVEAVRQRSKMAIILQTVPVPPLPLFGSLDARLPGSVRAQVQEANRGILALADEGGHYLLDFAALAERVGTDRWFDAVQWAAYKLPFASDCAAIAGDTLGRLLGAMRGKARKCLVLDLDNTCWGGVIGDDGLDGIVLGQGSARGEAFLSVQRMALELRERGIMLAISSKNDDELARRAFHEHPEMLLRTTHIAVFQANWTDKSSNLEAIARQLNIGLDALVMLDDNPVERAQMREALPMVAVPELPSDPAHYPWYLTSAGYFEATSFSREDRLRADSYAADAQRAEVMVNTRNLGDYLSSLGMTITFAPFDAAGRQRITQLINKTNQFNLTTRRYTEAEVAALEGDVEAYTLQVRLEDRFGDLGIVAVVICRTAHEHGELVWTIEAWLMSCRVLGRKVEEAMCAKLLGDAATLNIRRIVATWRPTAKNGIVREHYDRLGFAFEETAPDGTRRYGIAVTTDLPPVADLPMRVIGAPAGPTI